MKKLLLIFIVFCAIDTFGQVPEPRMLSLMGYGGNGYSEVEPNVTKTNDGGFIINIATNVIAGTGNIDSFCTGISTGDKAVFLKYNSDASTLEWSKCSSDGGYIFPQTDTFFVFGGMTTAVASGWAFKIIKEGASGTVLWNKTYGGEAASARLFGMIAIQDGGYIMVGETNYSDTDFTTHYGSWMDDDIAIIKVDSNGNKVWSKVIGGSAEDAATSIVTAPGNGCYVLGTTLSSDYDCTGNHGGDDIYLVRFDKDGNILWHKDIGGSGGENASSAFADGKGGVIIAGASNSLDGDRTHFPSFGCPIWALEVDSNKNILWDNCYGGGGGNCYANSICKATDGSIWIAGVSSIVGAEVDTNIGRDDAWIVHTDSIGNFLNARVLGSTLWDRGMMIYPLSNDNVITGGFYDTSGGAFSSVMTYSSYPNSNAFLTILSPFNQTFVSPITNEQEHFKMNPNPSKDKVTIIADFKRNTEITITDMLGKTVYKSSMIDTLQVSVYGWHPGIYYVQLINENGLKETKKLLVE